MASDVPCVVILSSSAVETPLLMVLFSLRIVLNTSWTKAISNRTKWIIQYDMKKLMEKGR